MLMKTNLIPPVVENNGAAGNTEPRAARTGTAWAMPGRTGLPEMDGNRLGNPARFAPFRFRINVKPGRGPRMTYRVLRKERAASRFRNFATLNSQYL